MVVLFSFVGVDAHYDSCSSLIKGFGKRFLPYSRLSARHKSLTVQSTKTFPYEFLLLTV
jgi:hypothetical protein